MREDKDTEQIKGRQRGVSNVLSDMLPNNPHYMQPKTTCSLHLGMNRKSKHPQNKPPSSNLYTALDTRFILQLIKSWLFDYKQYNVEPSIIGIGPVGVRVILRL